MEKQFPTIDKVKTGKQIRHLMDSLGLTVMDVQKYMGLATQQAVYHWLNGRSCLLYTSPSPRDVEESRMPSSA